MAEAGQQDVNIPAAKSAVVGEFGDRSAAERALEALGEAGYAEDHINLVTRGAHTDANGSFVPGALLVSVRTGERNEDAERILEEHGATNVHCDEVSATGELDESREAVV